MESLTIRQQSLQYPPRIHLGSLQTIEAPLSVGNQLKMFCQTIKGERRLLPDWGLPELIHKPAIRETEVEALILSNLTRYFPAVRLQVKATRDRTLGSIFVKITYITAIGYGEVTIAL